MPYSNSGGTSIYYEVVGAGAPILWLQGLGAYHTAWAVQTAHFSRNWQCILVDNRDTGHSDRSPDPYSIQALAQDALCVLDDAGVGSTHVVGLSMGGCIAQELALLAPDRVRSLSLLAAFARPDARMRAITGLWPEMYSRMGRVWFHRQAEPWVFSPAFLDQPASLRALRRYVEQDPCPQDPDAFARQSQVSNNHDTLDRLVGITARTLVVHGELDILVPPYLGRQLADGIHGARFELRPGVAHSVNLEGQRSFNALLESFLRGDGE